MIVGLTGGIASGKSTISKMFRDRGIEILDADRIAREISEEPKVQKKIFEVFGTNDRAEIKEIVFKDREKLRVLNGIIHPLVRERYVQEAKSTPAEEIKIFDIPLLFEAKMEDLCDIIVVIYVDKKTQMKRVMARDEIPWNLAKKIIESQMPFDEKVKRADFVIDNSGDLENLKEEFERVWKQIER